MIVTACPDRDVDNGPEAWGLPFITIKGPTFINAYCQAATNLVN